VEDSSEESGPEEPKESATQVPQDNEENPGKDSDDQQNEVLARTKDNLVNTNDY